MPDLDNMAKEVKGSWKKAVTAVMREPQKMGQVLAYVLSRCAVKAAGEGCLPAISEKLVELARLPVGQREQALKVSRFPNSLDGKLTAARAARKVGRLVCAGRVSAAEVPSVLAREFLTAVTESEFFGRLTEPDLIKIFTSAEAAKTHVACARAELEAYVEGAAPEFASSLFQDIERVEEPHLPKLSTEEQMTRELEVTLTPVGEDIAA